MLPTVSRSGKLALSNIALFSGQIASSTSTVPCIVSWDVKVLCSFNTNALNSRFLASEDKTAKYPHVRSKLRYKRGGSECAVSD